MGKSQNRSAMSACLGLRSARTRFGVLLVGLMGANACAQGVAPAGSQAAQPMSAWELALRSSTVHVAAHEELRGVVINRDFGRIAGGLDLALRRDVGRQHWHLSHASVDGPIAYRGFSQIGLPIATTTQLQRDRWQVGWDWRLLGGSSAAAQPGWQLAAGLRWEAERLDRFIYPSVAALGLKETLHERRVGASVRAGFERAGQDRVTGARSTAVWWAPVVPVAAHAQLQRFQTRRSRLDVNTFGIYDPLALALPASTHWRSEWGLDWSLAPQVRVQLRVGQQTLRPSAGGPVVATSQGQPVANITYPGAQIWLRDVGLGLSWRFE